MRGLAWIALSIVVAGIAGYEVRAETAHPQTAAVGAASRSAPQQAAQSRPAPRQSTGSGPAARGNGPPVEVTTATALAGALPDRRQTVGWVIAPQSVNLTSQSSGTVVAIPAKAGSNVKAGDLIAKLDPQLAQAAVAKDQAALQRDQATLQEAQTTLSNEQALIQKGADTTYAESQAEAAAKVAAANVALDQAVLGGDQTALANTEIRAPFDGRLGAFQISVGSLVQPGSSAVTLTQMAPVDVQFSVSENDLSQLRSAMTNGSATVEVTAPGASGDASGPVTFLDNAVDRGSGTVPVRGTLPNDDLALWPGELVSVTLDLGSRSGLVLVPDVAVSPSGDGGSIVYVVKPDQSIDVRPVEVAGSNGGMTAISAGLAANDRVVVEGQSGLTTGQRVRVAAGAATPPAPKAG